MTTSDNLLTQRQWKSAVYTGLWLIVLVVVNRLLEEPVQFIAPYVLPVIVLTWKYGVRWGLVAAAGAVVAAAAGGALPSNDKVALLEDGLYSYVKLSAIALGVSLGKLCGLKLWRNT